MKQFMGLAVLLLAAGWGFEAGAQAPVARVALQGKLLKPLPAGISVAEVENHVIEPANVRGIKMEDGVAANERMVTIPRAATGADGGTATPKLDVAKFGQKMHAALKDSTAGYTLQVRKNGATIYNLQWQWAKRPVDGGTGWTGDRAMHVASVSKFLTALGMVKTLDAKGISYDAKIAQYLPTSWVKGNNVDKITFRHLLTHTSGFNTGSSSSSYSFMKGKVAAGVPAVGSYDYENMNFGLCRILIPIINGDVNKSTSYFPIASINDQIWDAVTIGAYNTYMQNRVFKPAGVTSASFKPIAGGAYAYPFPVGSAKGWNSGDLKTMAGGAAWHLTLSQLLKVMDGARRRNTILPASKVQYMLDNRFGIDQVLNTPAGKLYNKNGSWNNSGKKEQSVAYFLPEGMEVAVFVNSPIGKNEASLRGLVKDSYVASLK